MKIQKIQFCRETELGKEPFYLTRVNGSFVSGSLSKDEATGRKLYEQCVSNNGNAEKREILDEIIIEETNN